MPPLIDESKCTKCGMCAQICPLDVIRIKKTDDQKKEIVVAYPYECWHCRACVKDCPVGAIKIRYPLSHMMLHMDGPEKIGGDN